MQKSKDANSTQCSQAVSHPSTNRAQHCLTSVIGRELVYSMWYGRCREKRVKWGIVLMQAALLGCEVRFCQLWNGMMLRGLSAWGVLIGSFYSRMSPSCSEIFQTFSLSYWEANSYYPRGPIMRKGSSPNFKTEWDRGFSVSVAFKLGPLQPIRPLLFPNFCNFFIFILGSHFLLPQRANNGKGEFFQLQNWMRQRVFSTLGIQTGPSAAH